MLKLAYFLRKIQTLRVNNSRVLTIKNAKFSGYYVYMNLNIWEDFQICISVPLMTASNSKNSHNLAGKHSFFLKNLESLLKLEKLHQT